MSILSDTISGHNMAGVAQYQWNCSEPDDRGQRYIPGVRDYNESDVLTNATDGSVVNLYRVRPDLNAECHGEVTAIEYCYQYNLSLAQETVFNWTVLVFEEGNLFTVTKVFAIESHPSLLSGDECTDVGEGRPKCCDRTHIEGFDQPVNNFNFGVTESAQGNTAGAILLGFIDDDTFIIQPQYLVGTLQVNKGGQNLSVGSTLPRSQVVQRGLRMLWFVIGKLTHAYYKGLSQYGIIFTGNASTTTTTTTAGFISVPPFTNSPPIQTTGK